MRLMFQMQVMIRDLAFSVFLFFYSKGLIGCRGRLLHANASFDTKFPVLLSPKARIFKLIVVKAHVCSLHARVADTLVAIRREF